MDSSQLQNHAYNLLEQNYQHQEWFVRFTACEAFAHIHDARILRATGLHRSSQWFQQLLATHGTVFRC